MALEPDKIRVIAPDGQLGRIPKVNLDSALADGFRLPTAQELEVQQFREENEGIGGAIKAFAGQALDEAAFGIPETIYDETASPIDIAKKEALKEMHPIASGAGAVTGFTGSLIGGPVSVAAKLGTRAAEKAIAKAAVEQGSKGIGKKILESAAKAGAENAAIGVPLALTEASLGDPETAAETLLLQGGLGAIAGGGLESIAKGIGFINSKIRPKAIIAHEKAIRSGKVIDDIAAQGDEVPSLGENVFAAGDGKRNADEIIKAGQDLGIEVTPGMITDNKMLQNLESSLQKSPGAATGSVKNQYNKILGTIQDESERIVGTGTEATHFEIGEAAKTRMISDIGERSSNAGAIYDEFEKSFGSLPVDIADKELLKTALDSSDAIKFDIKKLDDGTTKYPAFVENIKNRIDNIQTLDDIKKVRTLVGKEMAGITTPTIEKSVLSELYGNLTDLREATIQANIKRGKLASKAVDKIREADKIYKSIFDDYKEAGQVLGIKAKNVDDLVSKIENLGSEKLTDRMFKQNDYKAIQIIKEKFPDIFEQVAKRKMQDIYEKSVFNGEFSPRRFITNVKKLPQEAKNVLFDGLTQKKIRDIETVLNAIPKDINPSGTAQAIAYDRLLSLPMQLTEAGRMAFYRYSSGEIKGSIEKAIQAAKSNMVGSEIAKAQLKIDKGLKVIPQFLESISIEKGIRTGVAIAAPFAAAALAGNIEPKNRKEKLAEFQKIQKQISDMYSDLEKTNEIYSERAGLLTDSGYPNIGNMYQAKKVKALDYLWKAMPKPARLANPVFKEKAWEPTDHQLNDFLKKVKVVQNPFIVFDHLKKGVLSQLELDVLKQVYPKLFSQIQSSMINAMTEKPRDYSYQTKVKLSMLMDYPLDELVEHGNVEKLQMSYAETNQQIAQGTSQANGKSKIAENMQTETQKFLS